MMFVSLFFPVVDRIQDTAVQDTVVQEKEKKNKKNKESFISRQTDPKKNEYAWEL